MPADAERASPANPVTVIRKDRVEPGGNGNRCVAVVLTTRSARDPESVVTWTVAGNGPCNAAKAIQTQDAEIVCEKSTCNHWPAPPAKPVLFHAVVGSPSSADHAPFSSPRLT